jgi:uncharacterized protein (TIGR02466 family)
MTILHTLFPTPILQVPATADNYDLVQLEVQAAWRKIQADNDFTTVSYFCKESQEVLSAKTYNFIEKYNCKNLETRIYQAVDQYIKQIGWNGMNDGFIIKDSWMNIMDKGDFHTLHCHPGYTISGTYYFRVSDQQGSIRFNNPNPLMFHCNFPQGRLSPQTTDIVPDDGDVIVFPSWLVHGTQKNLSEEQRISIAFNLDPINPVEDRVIGLLKGSHMPVNQSIPSLKSMTKDIPRGL